MALGISLPSSVVLMTSSITQYQLSLFPDRCRLIKVVPEENKRRFYALRALPTLFGDWALQREWGRIGAGGRLRHDLYRDEGEALSALTKLAQLKVRRGYRSAD
jgi:predicted DNA-binding WGR domain protein